MNQDVPTCRMLEKTTFNFQVGSVMIVGHLTKHLPPKQECDKKSNLEVFITWWPWIIMLICLDRWTEMCQHVGCPIRDVRETAKSRVSWLSATRQNTCLPKFISKIDLSLVSCELIHLILFILYLMCQK